MKKYKYKNYETCVGLELLSFLESAVVSKAPGAVSPLSAYLWLLEKQAERVEKTEVHSLMPFKIETSEIAENWKCSVRSAQNFLHNLKERNAISLQKNGSRISIMVRNFADSDNEILYPEENSKTTSSAI